MRRTAPRAKTAPRLETLEPRELLSLGSPAGSLLVRFDANLPAAAVAADLGAIGGHAVTSYPGGPTLVALRPGTNRVAAMHRLQADPGVIYAETDVTFHTTVAAVAPSDPSFNQQWGLNNPATGVDLSAPAAWSITAGSPSTIVAVLDTGLDTHNPEFAGRLWTNPNGGHDPGFGGDLHGWNFVNNTSNIQDNNGHGTNVAGLLAADANNGVGVAGVDWNATIMPVKVLDSNGNGSTNAAVAGIYFAVNHGARVINASWGGGDYSPAMIDALNYANSHGVVFVTAAGNNGTSNDTTPSYPASYGLPNEIAVAAIDMAGNLASFSNYGASSVAIAAPGVNVLSTVLNGNYAAWSGTSMATPFVSGVVSLLASLEPNWSAAQLVHQVVASARPLPTLTGKVISGGMVNAYTTVSTVVPEAPANPGSSISTFAAPQLLVTGHRTRRHARRHTLRAHPRAAAVPAPAGISDSILWKGEPVRIS